MKVIAVIEADLDRTPLGTPSRLADELAGRTVLCRTVERLSGANNLAGVYLLCPAEQFERCRALVKGTGAIVQRTTYQPPSWRRLVRAARKWSLDSWRGGIGGMTHFDEYTDPRLIAALPEVEGADAVLSVTPSAVVVDPRLTDRMIDHHRTTGPDIRLTFTPAPPGLAGILLDTSFVHELARAGVPVGSLFNYKPDRPEKDLIFQPSCMDLAAVLRHAGGRLAADTDRAFRRLRELLRQWPEPDAEACGRWLLRQAEQVQERLPHEVEIELTTDDPHPDALLRPGGREVPARGPIAAETVAKIAGEMSRMDDSLLVLGGFGDPLRHPGFKEVLAAIRSAASDGGSLFGLAVGTTAVELGDALITSLIEHRVDVLSVWLDAWTPELYGRLHSPTDAARAELSAVTARMDRLLARMREAGSVVPIIVPTMTKAQDNVHELDAFHDGWLRRLGAVAIGGYSSRAGQREDRSVLPMSPRPREACRRIRSRLLVLADGTVVACDQDFRACHPVGDVNRQSLEQIWNGEEMNGLRAAHANRQFDVTALCAACDDWHRP